MALIFFLLATAQYTNARPPADVSSLSLRAPEEFEWTALGDSYATGVGSGDLIENGLCLRFTEAYPQQINNAPTGDFPGDPKDRKMNNVACSGAKTLDVMTSQFGTKNSWNPIYGSRPAFGKPHIATISVGGDDIDFPGLVRNCVYFIMPSMSCEEQLKHSWELLRAPKLVNDIEEVLKKTVKLGREGPAGEKFRLFVTEYADFFNAETHECDTVTWKYNRKNPTDGDKMTKELRKTFNNMADALNKAISSAVQRQAGQGVEVSDWQANGALKNHRYCEPGVKEPDPDRAATWFWHWPYAAEDDGAFENLVATTWDPSVSTYAQFEQKYPHSPPPVPAHLQDTWSMWTALYENAQKSDYKTLWLSEKVRVFHPTIPLHGHIKEVIIRQIGIDSIQPSPSPSPSPKAIDTCHVTWDLLFDSFTIKLADFDPIDFEDCDGLKHQIRHCAALTEFHCEKIHGSKYQWQAKGHLPVWTKDCVKSAIHRAGGPKHAHCSGSG